jgi:hypothetical protein
LKTATVNVKETKHPPNISHLLPLGIINRRQNGFQVNDILTKQLLTSLHQRIIECAIVSLVTEKTSGKLLV